MEQNPRATTRTDGLRPLGLPRPLRVRRVNGETHLRWRGREHRVAEVQEVWRLAEEWWREEPLARTYYRLLLDGGQLLTVFRDGHSGEWFAQHA